MVSTVCFFCLQQQAGLFSCSRCEQAWYCSEACQRQDWKPRHRVFCKLLVQSASSPAVTAKPEILNDDRKRENAIKLGRLEAIIVLQKTAVNIEELSCLYEGVFGTPIETPNDDLFVCLQESNLLDVFEIHRKGRAPQRFAEGCNEGILCASTTKERMSSSSIYEEASVSSSASSNILSHGQTPSLEDIKVMLLDDLEKGGVVEVEDDAFVLAVAELSIVSSHYGASNVLELVESFNTLTCFSDPDGRVVIHEKRDLETLVTRVKEVIAETTSIFDIIAGCYWAKYKEPLNHTSIGHDSLQSFLLSIPEVKVEQEQHIFLPKMAAVHQEQLLPRPVAFIGLQGGKPYVPSTQINEGWHHQAVVAASYRQIPAADEAPTALVSDDGWKLAPAKVRSTSTDDSKASNKDKKVKRVEPNNPIDSKPNKPTRNLHVCGFPTKSSTPDLKKIFSDVTQVASIHRPSPEYIFINTPTKQCAAKAKDALNDTVFNGGRLRIRYAKEVGKKGTSFN